MENSILLTLIVIGAGAGLCAGFFGVGGGIVIVPALVYFLGFSQHRATGTSLAILLPPVGLAAVLEYHRHGNVDIKAAVIVCLALFFGAWLSAAVANTLSGPVLKLLFGMFITIAGVYSVYQSAKQIYLRPSPQALDQQKQE